MTEIITIQGSKEEFYERLERWHQSDIMVPLQSYLCLTSEEWYAFLNGNIVFSEDLEIKRDGV